MASQISKRKAIPLAEFVADIDRRRKVAAVTELPRNGGKKRTASKRALLEAIEKAGGTW